MMRMSDRIREAKKIAEEIHGLQVDKKGYPYLAHVFDVAKRVAHLGEDYEIVGLLHDAIEDAPSERQASLLNEIEEKFGQLVRDGVDGMTKRIAPTKEDYKTEYLPRVAANPISKEVKIADASHNLSKAHTISDQAQQQRLRMKYSQALKYLGIDSITAERPIVYEEVWGWKEKD
jgi:(p)ppGpp synthase/HD superfamily hydrolase